MEKGRTGVLLWHDTEEPKGGIEGWMKDVMDKTKQYTKGHRALLDEGTVGKRTNVCTKVDRGRSMGRREEEVDRVEM